MMKILSALFCVALLAGSCGSKDEAATDKQVEKVRDAVKDVVTQEFKTLESAKDSLIQSEEKTKAALEAVNKELN